MPSSRQPNKFGLNRSHRIRKQSEFRSFDGESQRHVLRHFILLLKKRATPTPRLGITVSRSFGGATKRNRLKRKIREFFRTNKEKFASLDIHFIAKAMRRKLTQEAYESEITNDFRLAMEKARTFTE